MPFDAGQYSLDIQRLEAMWRERGRAVPLRPSTLSDADADFLTRVVNRLCLARALYSADVFSEVNRQAGFFEDTALRLFLLTTVIDLFGSNPVARPTYRQWLNSPEALTIASEPPPAGPEHSEPARRLDVARRLSERFNEHEITQSAFGNFFRTCISSEVAARIIDECWVFIGSPLVPTALHCIREPYNPVDPEPMSASLSRARTRWDSLDINAKLRDIANFLRTYRANYAHGLVTYWSTGEKDHLPTNARRAVALASAQPRMVSRRSIDNLPAADKYVLGPLTVGLASDCILLPDDITGNERTRLGGDMALWARVPAKMGETVFAWNRDMAMASYDQPLPECLMDWIGEALDSWITSRVR